LNVFGYNAPDWDAMSSDFRNNYPGGEGQSEWPNFVISPRGEPVVDLDGSHPDVVADSRVVLATSTQRELWRVDHVTEIARAQFATSGKVTRATLKGGENYSFFHGEVRGTTVYAVEERLELADAPDDSAVGGNVIDVDTDVSEMAPGRSLLVTGTTTSGAAHAEVVTVAGAQQAAGRWRLTLERSLVEIYDRATVVVHGNVALATHGETVDQLLGSGHAAKAFQRFDLAHEPLTHVQSSDASGVSSTLEVRVNDVRWDELPTLYGAATDARAYTVRSDENDKTYVQFGDGQRGARLPSGAQNVRATYRKGLGAGGNVRPNTLAQLLDRPLGVKGVTNPLPASGGVDPEAEEQARTSMPIGVRTLGRAVSLTDYADFALAFAGVAKADAAVLPLRSGPTIVVTVAFADRPPVVPVDRLDDLRDALRGYGDPHVQVDVVPHAERNFRLALKVAVDPAFEAELVLAGVESAVRMAYSFESRGFGAPVHASAITSIVHGVDGVVAVDLDRLYAGPIPLLLQRLAAQRAAVGPDGTALPAGLLLLHPDPLDWLEVMT
jgi:predicted phage baseplate assembly protein